jgi:hypothetical protein
MILEVEKILFMATTTYPGKSISAAANKLIEIVTNDPPPDYIKRTYYVAFGGKGIKAYALYDMEEGKEAAGFRQISRRAADAMQSIEGYEIAYEVVMTLEEAFTAINMQAP